MRQRVLMTIAAIVAALTVSPAVADEVICDRSQTPHVADQIGDYEGFVFGTGTGTPLGDVNGDGNDLIAGSFTMEAVPPFSSEQLTAVMRVASLSGRELNLQLRMWWDHPHGDSAQARRWVSATAIRPGATGVREPTWTFHHGYFGPGGDTGATQSWILGQTSGAVDVATGTVRIHVPTSIGRVQAGDMLGFPQMQAYFYAGQPGTTGQLVTVDLAAGPCEVIAM